MTTAAVVPFARESRSSLFRDRFSGRTSSTTGLEEVEREREREGQRCRRCDSGERETVGRI